MAAGETGIYVCRYAKTGASPTAVAGVTHCRIEPTTVRRVNPALAGMAGPQGSLMTHADLAVTLFGLSLPALLALLSAAKSSVVLGLIAGDGSLEKHTLTNVKFDEAVGTVEIPEADAGGKIAPFAVRGHVGWGVNDTLATVWTWAVDPP